MENRSLALHIPEYGSEAMEITRLGPTIDVWSLAVDAKVDLRKALADVSHVPTNPTGMSARRAQGGFLGTCGEHNGKADRCVTISPDQTYAALCQWLP